MSAYQKYQNNLSFKNKLGRLVWNFVYTFLFRPLDLPFFNGYRIAILRLFGAQIGQGCKINARAKIWAPWRLIIGDLVAIGFDAYIYNPGIIKLGSKITISQRSHLCSASHDITKADNPLTVSGIVINDRSWVAADAFIGPGVIIGEGAVVGARAAVFKDVKPWTVVGGNPAKFLKDRVIIS